MDGKEYFDAIEHRLRHTLPRCTAKSEYGYVKTSDTSLTQILSLLYSSEYQEVEFLMDDVTPEVYEVSQQTISDRHFILSSVKKFVRSKRPKSSETILHQVAVTADESTRQLDLMAQLKEGARQERQGLIDFSNDWFAYAVSGMFQQRRRIEEKKTTPYQIIRDSFGCVKNELRDVLDENVLRIDIARLFTGDIVRIQSNGAFAGRRIPEWIHHHHEWSEELSYRVARGLLELDAFSAVFMWLQDRRLPALVVAAPNTIESGEKLRNGKNPNADLLIASLEKNIVIPLQVKHYTSLSVENKYMKGIKFLNPTRLGLVERTNERIKQRDFTKTVDIYTTHYGSHAALLLAKLSMSKPAKRITEGPQRLIQHAYDYLDTHLLSELT